MTTQTLTLADFLLARIAEDEAHFHAMAEHEADRCRRDGMPDTTREEVEAYWLRREDGAAATEWPRWLAECEAKRQIVELHGPMPAENVYCMTCDENNDWPCATLKALALPYADHPDFREEWKP